MCQKRLQEVVGDAWVDRSSEFSSRDRLYRRSILFSYRNDRISSAFDAIYFSNSEIGPTVLLYLMLLKVNFKQSRFWPVIGIYSVGSSSGSGFSNWIRSRDSIVNIGKFLVSGAKGVSLPICCNEFQFCIFWVKVTLGVSNVRKESAISIGCDSRIDRPLSVCDFMLMLRADCWSENDASSYLLRMSFLQA